MPLIMEAIWILSFFFVFITIVFLVFAFFFPEWIGITGKKARSVMDEHKPDESDKPREDNFGS